MKKILLFFLVSLGLLQAEQKPNVVLIYTDDLGIGLIGAYGQKLIKTPHIDRLATEGMKFTNYYGGTLCAPARWSLHTGMHFGRKGAWRHNAPGFLIRSDLAKKSDKEQLKELNAYVNKTSAKIPDNEVFLAQVAQKADYKTAQFGKLDVGFLTNHERVKRFGWDHYHGYYSHSRAHGFYPPYLWKNGEKVRYKGNDDVRCGKMTEKGDEPVGSGGEIYSEHLFIEGALDFITEHKDEPFFLYYATQLPHGPVAIPKLHKSVKDNDDLSLAEKKYASMVIMLDDHVGLIMKKLKTLGLDENTVVFFTSDNGHELYYGPKSSFPKSMHGEKTNLTDKKWRTSEGGDVFDGAGGRAGIKRSAYQGGKQCPMIVRWPDKIKAGSQTELLSSHYDFMATMANLTGQEVPKGKDGISYLPSLLGKEQVERHDYILFDNSFKRMGKTALITKEGWKVVEVDRVKDEFQLYNIIEDNEERHEISEKHPEKFIELKELLLKELRSPRTDLISTQAKVLLISPPELKEAWEKYIILRKEQGTAMELVTTDEIAKKYEGPDLQEKIRLCAREYIDKHKFHTIVLGGDSTEDGGLIPDRDTYHKNMWGNDTDIPSDLYYISPTNWDHDGDGVYGEFEEDREAISYPDGSIAIGRIPVRTAEDIEAYGRKVVAHLAQKPSKQLALTCTVRSAYAKVLKTGLKLVPDAWPGGKTYFFFNDKTSWDGEEPAGSYELNSENLSEKFMEEGMNKWHLHGHGFIDRWVLEGRQAFSYEQIKEMKNSKQPLVITTVSCFTGQFDNEHDPCVTEAMLRQLDGGAVVIVAPAREGKPHFHDMEADFPLMVREGKLDGTTQTMAGFWVAALGKNKNVGMALSESKSNYAEDAQKTATYHQGICEINLLGDPTLPVR